MAIFGAVAFGFHEAFEGIGKLGNSLGPGYGDLLQGATGLGLLLAGPRLALQTNKKITQERVQRNIEESRQARAASNFERHARIEKAYSFYREAGFSPDRTMGHLQGIDLSKPIAVTELQPGAKYVQYVQEGRVGNYFAPPATPAGALGINPASREAIPFTPSKPVSALQSSAANIVDTWTVPGQPYSASGGGTQFFVPEKAAMVRIGQ